MTRPDSDSSENEPEPSMRGALRYPFDINKIFVRRRGLRAELADSAKGPEVRIAFLGGSTTSDVRDALELFLLDMGLRPVFYESEYNQYYDDVVLDNPLLAAFKPQIAVVFTSSRNVLHWPEAFATEERVAACFEAEVGRYRAIWEGLSKKFGCMIIQNNFDPPVERPLGPLEASLSFGGVNFVARLNEAFAQETRKRASFVLNDIHGLSAFLGLQTWHSRENWYGFKIAMSRAGVIHTAHDLARLVGAMYGKTRKVLVLDLDNTLWGGVIGDDGLGGLKLGRDDALGEAYVEFQHYCLDLKHRGVLLAVCSKNDDAIAKSGFSHPDSVLRVSDFSAFRANWEPKHENLISIAKELNLGLDSFVFVDDNPAERAIVSGQLPEVAVPDVGSDVARFTEFLEREGYFDATTLSADDAKRSAFYEADAKRAELTGAFANYEDYLHSLDMTAEIAPFHDVYLPRIQQLANKTNQFNLTSRRYTLAEMKAFAEAPDVVTLYGRLIDKFGDNGLVSVLIGKHQGEEIHLDLWLMSCRVLKRDFELAMFDELVAEAHRRGARALVGEYIRTAKNAMVENHYELLGFNRIEGEIKGDRSVWRYEVPEAPVRRNTSLKEIVRTPNASAPETADSASGGV